VSRCRHEPEPADPGLRPDPSIVRADGVYYLVTWSFEYLPGRVVGVYATDGTVTFADFRYRGDDS